MASEAKRLTEMADMDSSRRESVAGESRVEFAPARIPKLVGASPAPAFSPSKTAQALQADMKRHLQSHQLYMCIKRQVPCRFAEWGCDMRFPQEEQEAHEANQCIVAERRRKIAADALLVNEEIICEWCQQKVKKRKLLDHQEDECPERERPCPNAVNGCKEWVPVGKFDEHIRTDCIVTIERNTLAARAREMNSPVTCPECGVVVRLRCLDRHFRDECVSRIVPCKNAAHGCKARLRWRDRHLHEDFMSLSKDRSMLEFKTGGNAYIAINNSKSQAQSSSSFDLPPPWTAEYFVWMVDADEEILSLHKRSLELMETVAINTRENEQWQAKSDACKKKLKELKQKRKRKAADKALGTAISGGEMSNAAKQLADDFNDAENGLLATRKEIALARGWIEINILEAKRILDADVADEDAKQALAAAIADQTKQLLHERMLLVQLLPEAERAVLSDLDAWAKQLTNGSPSKASKAELQRKAAEQNKLLKKRSELQAQLEALDPDDADTPRLQRRFEREIAKADAKLALVSENKPTQLLERCGRHIIASSAQNVISLAAGPKGEVAFYRPAGTTAAREVNFQTRLARRRWNHVALAAGAKELSLFVNGELRSTRRGVFELPMSRIGARDQAESFQGYVLEVRYWGECRSLQQLQQHAASILRVASCKALRGYWTLEEGAGELVDDMALRLPRAACFGTAWVLFDSPELLLAAALMAIECHHNAMASDDDAVAFQAAALDVVGSWLLGGDAADDAKQAQTQQHAQQQRRPVTLYRPTANGAKSLPSLTRPGAAQDATLTEQEREMKRKLLRKPRGSRAEEAAKAEQEAERQRDEAQDQEEQELVRLKTQAASKDDRKRKRTAQDELLDKLREEAVKKKAKNLKRKLQLQRKKQQQREQQSRHTAAN
ncbi:unnamed protein product [Phytophthora fragariaefolia]|uniref:Unnamed protein product n=1 Tax=Phytophthora fragariaefolia TaxID=1490495 RepID=A0A9W7D284_9STRA|nr:unnamed protein product [Phytophthora fragariaefolia]